MRKTSTPRMARRNLYSELSLIERHEEMEELGDTDNEIDEESIGIKHDFTPNSKNSNQPKAKRFLVGEYFLSKMHLCKIPYYF